MLPSLRIDEKLSIIFSEVLGIAHFSPGIEMEQVAEWDSLKHIQLLAAIEESFGIEIQFEDAITMISGAAIVSKIEQYILDR